MRVLEKGEHLSNKCTLFEGNQKSAGDHVIPGALHFIVLLYSVT